MPTLQRALVDLAGQEPDQRIAIPPPARLSERGVARPAERAPAPPSAGQQPEESWDVVQANLQSAEFTPEATTPLCATATAISGAPQRISQSILDRAAGAATAVLDFGNARNGRPSG
jgi:hypothetical protein